MRVLLCGGGSAGHVNPALAIAETILKNAPKSKVAYVCTVSGIENDLVHMKKYHIDVSGINKHSLTKNIKSVFLAIKAIKKSKEIIQDFSPDVVIGTGGYATFPVISAAKKLKIKTVLHESNAFPGRTIKLLESKADLILTNFLDSEKYFKDKSKIECVGNPVREKFLSSNREVAKEKIKQRYVILCCGGSLGAEKINEAAIDIVENFIRYRPDVKLILSTGKKSYYDVCETVRKKRLDKLENFSILEYIHDMANKMAMADIVISRAGATTISELATMQKCSILIPSPNVANNHQYKNAKALEEDGAAIVITEDRLYTLTDVAKDLIGDREKRKSMERKIKSFYNPNANQKIYESIMNLVE